MIFVFLALLSMRTLTRSYVMRWATNPNLNVLQFFLLNFLPVYGWIALMGLWNGLTTFKLNLVPVEVDSKVVINTVCQLINRNSTTINNTIKRVNTRSTKFINYSPFILSTPYPSCLRWCSIDESDVLASSLHLLMSLWIAAWLFPPKGRPIGWHCIVVQTLPLLWH